MDKFEDKVFIGFVIAVSLAMGWIIMPFFGAILWGLVAAIMFMPLNDQLVKELGSRNGAAGLTLLIIVSIVIIPFFIVGSLMIDEIVKSASQVKAGQFDFAEIVAKLVIALPDWMQDLLTRVGFGNMTAIQRNISSLMGSGLKLAASESVNVAQGAMSFFIALGIMLYLTYFLLRDGRKIIAKVGHHLPMKDALRDNLFEKFVTVIRATVKGSMIVAIVQGLLGGTLFAALGINGALLWGVVMGIFALVPMIGTGVVWVPVAIYLILTGALWQGVVLLLAGFFVISMIDNVLRPILVGKDTRMPDYVVLIATLGGISVIGINGFIVGPVIAALFIAAWDIFADDDQTFV